MTYEASKCSITGTPEIGHPRNRSPITCQASARRTNHDQELRLSTITRLKADPKTAASQTSGSLLSSAFFKKVLNWNLD